MSPQIIIATQLPDRRYKLKYNNDKHQRLITKKQFDELWELVNTCNMSIDD